MRARSVLMLGGAIFTIACLVIAGSRVRASAQAQAGELGALLDPRELGSPRLSAFAYDRLMRASGSSAEALAQAPRHRAIVAAVESDIGEFTAGHETSDPRRAFRPTWLRSPRAHFDLIGIVPRLDRAFAHPRSCGEMRLVYRLAFRGANRPATRLPFTLNALFVVPRTESDPTCAVLARTWRAVFDDRADAKRVAAILPPLESLRRVEINYQSIHVPSYRTDMEDQAEYTLRAFDVAGDALSPAKLFNTPRSDLTPSERAALASWIVEHARDVDEGRAVLPEHFLATRAISRSPSGLARAQNRVMTSLLEGEPSLTAFPYGKSAFATSPRRLLLRLDEMTCMGCHQSRSVAGFHLLGRDREPLLHIDALATAGSPQFHDELAWRARLGEAIATGKATWAARPFVSHAADRVGGISDLCDRSPSPEAWTCKEGLSCAALHDGEWGECVRTGPPQLGDACESVKRTHADRPEGDLIAAEPRECATPERPPLSASQPGSQPICAPNWLGFAGGLCTALCTRAGERIGDLVCAPLPSEGYEADCLVHVVPIESCMKAHSQLALVPTCSGTRRCRGDYACAAFASLGGETGVCVPPYFLFQTRVDGPVMDR